MRAAGGIQRRVKDETHAPRMRLTLLFLMRLTLLFFLCLATVGVAGGTDYFTPGQRVSGIGVDRDNISPDLLDVRTDRMIESQTFAILRDPQAGPGAKRITGSASLQS